MEAILENGIKLIYKKSLSNLTSICISLDAGACKEEELFGLAHATEHMVYKGTKKRSEEEINKELSEIFAFQNAMTNFPYVIYYGSLLNEDVDKALDIFSDIIINPTFKEEGFKEEMGVIKEELKEWDEELEQFCEDKLFFNSFNKRRIKYPIIGRFENLEKIELKDLKNFYDENYVPNKTSIAVVSSLEFDKVKEMVEKYFLNWKGIKEEKEEELIYDFKDNNVFYDTREGVNSCRVQMIFKIDELSLDEIKALRIFNEFFSEGVNSLLFDNLRTKNGLIYDVLPKIAFEKYIKLYKITYNTSKENLDKSLEVLEECIENIEKYFENVSEENIKAYIKSIKLKRWFREEQNIILAKELSTYDTMFNDYNIYYKEVENLVELSKEFILNTAKKVLKNKIIEVIK